MPFGSQSSRVHPTKEHLPANVISRNRSMRRAAAVTSRGGLLSKAGRARIQEHNSLMAKWRANFKDLFHFLLGLKTWTLLLVFFTTYTVSYLFFAIFWFIMYKVDDTCLANVDSFSNAFLFSLETQSTIGFGSKAVNGSCAIGVFVILIQNIVGSLVNAALLGLLFARISAPDRRVFSLRCSHTAVVCSRDGQKCLMVRVGDMRQQRSTIVNCSARLLLLSSHVTQEGEVIPFYQQELDLVPTSATPFLSVPAEITHIIDEDSPLHNLTQRHLRAKSAELVLIVSGEIVSLGSTMELRSSFLPDEIKFGYRFTAVPMRMPDGSCFTDWSLFDEIVKEEPRVRRKTLTTHPLPGVEEVMTSSDSQMLDGNGEDMTYTPVKVTSGSAIAVPRSGRSGGGSGDSKRRSVHFDDQDDEKHGSTVKSTLNAGHSKVIGRKATGGKGLLMATSPRRVGSGSSIRSGVAAAHQQRMQQRGSGIGIGDTGAESWGDDSDSQQQQRYESHVSSSSIGAKESLAQTQAQTGLGVDADLVDTWLDNDSTDGPLDVDDLEPNVLQPQRTVRQKRRKRSSKLRLRRGLKGSTSALGDGITVGFDPSPTSRSRSVSLDPPLLLEPNCDVPATSMEELQALDANDEFVVNPPDLSATSSSELCTPLATSKQGSPNASIRKPKARLVNGADDGVDLVDCVDSGVNGSAGDERDAKGVGGRLTSSPLSAPSSAPLGSVVVQVHDMSTSADTAKVSHA
eukprot:m.9745 g.9745  ORF g.9745 m.9745 type:complete len:740 (+) comp5488_c0_seq1:398-2617(+)